MKQGGVKYVRTESQRPRLGSPRRRRPELVATRVTPAEKAWIEALAQTEGVTVTALIYDMVMPEVRERLAQSMCSTL